MQNTHTTKTVNVAARAVVIASVVLLAASCGDGDGDTASTTPVATDVGSGDGSTTVPVTPSPQTSAPEPPTTTTTTTTALAPIASAASEPPPASYSEVQADFEASTAGILAAGRAVADDMLAGDFQSVVDQFDETMTAAVSVEDLEAGWSDLDAQAPLGAPITERVSVLVAGQRVYQADLAWGDGIVSASTSFDDAGLIAGFFLKPRTPLPEDPYGDHASSIEYRVPFEGVWFVAWGGRTELQNYHVPAPDQRHAVDLLIWKDGATHTGDGTANEDYWAYGQTVVAPADGTVVTVVDGLPDQTPQIERDPSNPAGNHVVIEVANGEYVLIAHMQPGSIAVAEGDAVTSGQLIGLVGNSGNTTEPHIHIHVQDQPTFGAGAIGIPIAFSNYVADGEPVTKGELLADQFVSAS